MIDWNISRLSSVPTMAAIMSISLRYCLSMSARNRPCARTHHFALHIVIELDPSFFRLWSKCSAKLLFQAPYQRVAKRSEMQWLRPRGRSAAAEPLHARGSNSVGGGPRKPSRRPICRWGSSNAKSRGRSAARRRLRRCWS
jgi:hypothetical protein